jgi:hypothetical protein
MRRAAAILIGLAVAPFYAISVTELDFGGSNSLWFAPLVGALATFVLYPDNARDQGEIYVVTICSLAGAAFVAYFGWILWMAQYIPE